MQPTATDIKQRGDLGGRKVAMRFDENSIAHIMSVLTDLYSDPELAVIREYATNAIDSHIEAGIKRPIEISTPTGLSPFFKVKDFGTGLSVDDIVDIYSKYGASTKRDTDEQTGMLGLGCKSALTYTNQFTLIAIKNGTKVQVSVSRTDEGTGQMEIIDTKASNEPNGVEIIVPVNRANAFESKAKNLFRFWKSGTVLVNGKQPERFAGDEVTPGIWVVSNSEHDTIVMGGVAYPVNRSLYEGKNYQHNFNIVAYVDMGNVNFTPSRESLHYTTRTIATINDIARKSKAALWDFAQKDIDKQPSHIVALKRSKHWHNLIDRYNRQSFKYQGVTLPDQIRIPHAGYQPHAGWNKNSKGIALQPDFGETNTVVYGLNPDDLTSYRKSKVKRYTEVEYEKDNSFNLHRSFIFVKEIPTDPDILRWIDVSGWIDWHQTINLTPMSTSKGRTYTKKKRYEVWDSSGYFAEVDIIPDPTAVMVFGSKQELGRAGHDILNVIAKTPNVQIVRLASNRWNKFKRDFAKTQPIRQAIENMLKVATDKLTENDKILLHADYHDSALARLIDETQVTDPAIRRYVKIIKNGESSQTYQTYLKRQKLLRAYIYHWETPEPKNKIEAPFDRYKLLREIRSSLIRPETAPHVYAYMNMVYKEGI